MNDICVGKQEQASQLRQNVIGAGDEMLNENDVIAAVCDHLQTLGYRIVSRCTTTDQGIDIVAEHLTGAERLLIEAKGGTSAREGSARFDKGFNTSQVRHQVAHGFYMSANGEMRPRSNV